MMPSANPSNVVVQLKKIVDANNRSEIRLNANGGNSVLIACDPSDELKFIECLKAELGESFEIIDVNRCLLEFVDDNKELLDVLFDLRQASTDQIFKAPQNEEIDDLFGRIITEIGRTYDRSKIPVIVNTGALYGAGIDNIQIVEHETVMRASQPLVVLYPATREGDALKFLGARQASKYRCMIIP